jgi:hypothetical protein
MSPFGKSLRPALASPTVAGVRTPCRGDGRRKEKQTTPFVGAPRSNHNQGMYRSIWFVVVEFFVGEFPCAESFNRN